MALATTSSGTGAFQFGNNCLLPTQSPAASGTQLVTGSCSDASATGFTLGPSDSDSTVPTAQGTILVNGLCLDANGGTPRFEACSAGASQEWTWDPMTTEMKSISTGECLTVGAFGPGQSVSLASCTASGPGLIHVGVTPAGFDLMFVNGIAASSTFNGPHPPYTPPTVPPSASANPQCLDVFLDSETLPNAPIDNFQCNATNAQWFRFTTGGQLQTLAGTCVTALGASAGAGVQVETCNGSTGQQWLYGSEHLYSALDAEFVAPFSLDVQNESAAPLTVTDLGDTAVEGAPAGQTWAANLIWPAEQTIVVSSGNMFAQEEEGNATLTIHSNGKFEYKGGVHDFGAGADYFTLDAYPTAPAAGTRGPIFDGHGQVFGTFEPGSRDSNWDATGVDSEIIANWQAIQSGGITFRLHVATAVGTDIGFVALDVGVATLAIFTGGECINSVVNNSATVSAYSDQQGGGGVQINCN